MGYDRYDTRDTPRDERSRWSEDRNFDRERGRDRSGPDNRGFFERAGDEIASWFGDDDAERRRREDEQRNRPDRPEGSWSGRDHDRGWERDRSMSRGDQDRGFHDRGWERGQWLGETRGYSASE